MGVAKRPGFRLKSHDNASSLAPQPLPPSLVLLKSGEPDASSRGDASAHRPLAAGQEEPASGAPLLLAAAVRDRRDDGDAGGDWSAAAGPSFGDAAAVPILQPPPAPELSALSALKNSPKLGRCLRLAGRSRLLPRLALPLAPAPPPLLLQPADPARPPPECDESALLPDAPLPLLPAHRPQGSSADLMRARLNAAETAAAATAAAAGHAPDAASRCAGAAGWAPGSAAVDACGELGDPRLMRLAIPAGCAVAAVSGTTAGGGAAGARGGWRFCCSCWEYSFR